jgi:hypothetical protein
VIFDAQHLVDLSVAVVVDAIADLRSVGANILTRIVQVRPSLPLRGGAIQVAALDAQIAVAILVISRVPECLGVAIIVDLVAQIGRSGVDLLVSIIAVVAAASCRLVSIAISIAVTEGAVTAMPTLATSHGVTRGLTADTACARASRACRSHAELFARTIQTIVTLLTLCTRLTRLHTGSAGCGCFGVVLAAARGPGVRFDLSSRRSRWLRSVAICRAVARRRSHIL